MIKKTVFLKYPWIFFCFFVCLFFSLRISWGLKNEFESATVNELSEFVSLFTHLCPVSHLRDIGKQYRPRSDAAHYENTPIQIYRTFHLEKNESFQTKTQIFFNISAQNIDCGYSLEPPRRGGSNEYPQSMFWAEIRKIMYTPVNPSFTI